MIWTNEFYLRKKKPTSIEKPSSYAAQFAARKGLNSKQQRQQEQPEIYPNQPNLNASYSSNPTPYQYLSNPKTSYINSPIYKYNPGYLYSYDGMSPQQFPGGLPLAGKFFLLCILMDF